MISVHSKIAWQRLLLEVWSPIGYLLHIVPLSICNVLLRCTHNKDISIYLIRHTTESLIVSVRSL